MLPCYHYFIYLKTYQGEMITQESQKIDIFDKRLMLQQLQIIS